MARTKETPLTTKALNAFLQTAHAELEKSGFSTETEQNLLCEIAGLALPVGDPLRGHESLGFVLAASPRDLAQTPERSTMPETMSALKKRIDEHAFSDFVESDGEEKAASETYKAILRKAYRAAEKTMTGRSL